MKLLIKLLTIKVFISRKDFRACLVYRGQKVVKVSKTAKWGCYKGIKRLIGKVPLFRTTAQPTAGRLPYLA